MVEVYTSTVSEDTYTREALQPKPFIFVLMPFDKVFSDIYQFGIKGAAEDIGAYAERLDDQIFTDGILDRIFNQINRADVIVADMTGRNANVFYEVGYAHALGKIVLLLTQDAEDIPFDLKHRQHVVYGQSIDSLRKQLAPRIAWAVREAQTRRSPSTRFRLRVTLAEMELPTGVATGDLPVISIDDRDWNEVPLAIWNESVTPTTAFSHVYLFTQPDAAITPYHEVKETVSRPQMGGFNPRDGSFPKMEYFETLVERFLSANKATASDAPDGLTDQYRLPNVVTAIPAGAVEHDILRLGIHTKRLSPEYTGSFRLRFHGNDGVYDFSFRATVRAPREE